MSTVKMLLGLAVVCAAVLGLMFAFGVLTAETLSDNAAQIGGGIAILFVAAIALKGIAGRGPGGQTDPPPQL